MVVNSVITPSITRAVRRAIDAIPQRKTKRWIASSNNFVIADTNGRIITAGK